VTNVSSAGSQSLSFSTTSDPVAVALKYILTAASADQTKSRPQARSTRASHPLAAPIRGAHARATRPARARPSRAAAESER
jgi:hypothetical protein